MSHGESPMSILRESPMSIRESPANNMDKSLDYSISSQTQAAMDATTRESLSMFNESTPSFTSFEQEIMRQQASHQAQNSVQDDLFSQSTAEFNKSCEQFKGTFEAWWKAWDQPLSEDTDGKKKPKKTKRQQLLEKAKQVKPGATPNIARSPTAEGTVPDNRTVWLESILNRLQQPPIFSPETDTEAEPAQVSPDPHHGDPGRRTFTC